MQLRLFNSLTRTIEPFGPLHQNAVGMYSCGPTVYNRIHIGNLRAYIVSDILHRILVHSGFNLTHVMNITDVGHLTDDADSGDDKMERAARQGKESAYEIAARYTELFLQDIAKLNILQPDVLPKATEHIPEQIRLIERLEEGGHTYQTSDGVYFDTSTFPEYGRLANLNNQQLQEGARVEKNAEKRNPTDFALWKFSPKTGEKRQMEWPSPWGVGFPGWHIECSAMAMKYLGESFDIHTGGIDHIPIHHTNEIAQSEAATGKPFARFWVHNEFLRINDAKMAKSAGNFVSLDELAARNISPIAYRYFAMNTHYRKPLAFSWEALSAAQAALDTLIATVRGWKAGPSGLPDFEERFLNAVHDDMNIPKALGIMWEMIKSHNDPGSKRRALNSMDAILGLGLTDLDPFEIPAEILELAKQRELARKNNDFVQADELREQILAKGFSVEDTKEGPLVKPAS